MSEYFAARPGAVLSADIAVPEHDKEVQFYSRVLSTGDRPLWREDLMNNMGIPIIGLGARIPEYEALPLQWMPHIQVADVAESVRRAVELGGKVLMHPTDDEGRSQWAVLLDPNGAAFGIIPVVSEEAIPSASGSAGTGSVGRIAWLDVTVPDANGTRDFYISVVGWAVEEVGMRDGDERYADYSMLDAHGKPSAGVCHARGVNADLPPVWMIYLPVGDLGESLKRVEQEGGTIVKQTYGKNGEPYYAVVRDPVGVYVALTPDWQSE